MFADWIPPRSVPLAAQRDSLLLLLLPLCSYFATTLAIAVTNNRLPRFALLPITLYSAFHAATVLDVAAPFDDERYTYLNQGLILVMTGLSMRCINWTFRNLPFYRTTLYPPKPYQTVLDAADLMFSLRAYEWNCAPGLRLPPETRPKSTGPFTIHALISGIIHLLIFDISHSVIQLLTPNTSIYDPVLTGAHRYVIAWIASMCAGLMIYTGIQAGYDLCTVCGICLLRQSPRQWPPLFHSFWFSSSVNQFWGYWHQLFRDSFVGLGYVPLARFGRASGVMGAFFVSGLLHLFALWGMGRGSEPAAVLGFFLMNGLGVVLEGLWRRVTGYRVKGFFGWMWTVLWVMGWLNILIDAWARTGLMQSLFFPEVFRPGRYIVDLVLAFIS